MSKTKQLSDFYDFIDTADNDTLNEIVAMVKSRRDVLVSRVKTGIRRGDKVAFNITGKRRPGTNGRWEGTVESVLTKNVRVKAINTNIDPGWRRSVTWKVPITMIEKV